MGLSFGLSTQPGMPGVDNTAYQLSVVYDNDGVIHENTYTEVPEGATFCMIGSTGGEWDGHDFDVVYSNPTVTMRSMELDRFIGGADTITSATINFGFTVEVTANRYDWLGYGSGWQTTTEVLHPNITIALQGIRIGDNGKPQYTHLSSQDAYTNPWDGAVQAYPATNLVKAYLNSRSDGYDAYAFIPQLEGWTPGAGAPVGKEWLWQLLNNTVERHLTYSQQEGHDVGWFRTKNVTWTLITGSGGVFRADPSKLVLPDDCRINRNHVPAGVR